MDYIDCANILYKMAIDSTGLNQDDKKVNYAVGGAGLGGFVGVADQFKKNMGPKKILNENFVKGTKKNHPDFDVIGKKKVNQKFGKRIGTLGQNISKHPGSFAKGMMGKGLVGAGVGLAGGALLSGLVSAAPQDKIASLIDAVATDRDIDNLRKGEIAKILEAAKERRENSFLDDIDCEVCGYEGKPTNKGCCPNCGAVLGKMEEYIPAIKPSVPYDGYPMNGVSVYEQAEIDNMEVQASEKLAMARAWKTNFSEGIRDTLESHGLLNYEKEMAGLNLGTANIAKKIGIPITQMKTKAMADRATKGTFSDPLGKHFFKNVGMGKRDLKQQLNNIIDQSGGYASYVLGKDKMINRGADPTAIFQKYPVNVMVGDGVVHDAKYMSPFHKEYLDAIFTRHETDEARGAMNAIKKGRKMSYGGSDNAGTQLATGHQTPTVMFRESANVATAPPELKKFLTKTRNSLGDGPILDKYFSHQYGSSGKLDVSGMNKAEKILYRENKPYYDEILNR